MYLLGVIVIISATIYLQFYAVKPRFDLLAALIENRRWLVVIVVDKVILVLVVITVTTVRIVPQPVDIVVVDKAVAAFAAAVEIIVAVRADGYIFIGYGVTVQEPFTAMVAGKSLIVIAVLAEKLSFDLKQFVLVFDCASAVGAHKILIHRNSSKHKKPLDFSAKGQNHLYFLLNNLTSLLSSLWHRR